MAATLRERIYESFEAPAVPARWALAEPTRELLLTLMFHLDHHTAELRDRYADKSERWLEGDEAGEVDTWLDELDELRDTLDNIEHSVGK